MITNTDLQKLCICKTCNSVYMPKIYHRIIKGVKKPILNTQNCCVCVNKRIADKREIREHENAMNEVYKHMH